MIANGHANGRPASREDATRPLMRLLESQTLYASQLLGDVDWTERGPDGRPDPWVPSGSRRRNTGEGEAQPIHFTEEQLHLIRARSRELCSTNEFAICAVENRKNYVVGKDFLARAVALPTANAEEAGVKKLVAMTQSVIDAFYDSCELPDLAREFMGRMDEEGEGIVRLFPQPNGILALRDVEPEHLRPPAGWGGDARYSYGVETAQGDVETPVAYWINERPDVSGSGPTRVPAEEIVHVKLNVKRTAKRGVPTFYAVDDNLRRAEDLLVSMTSMAKTRAKIAAHRKLTGATAATARSLLDALTVATLTDPGTQQTVSFEKMRYGSILTTGGNVEWEFPTANVEIDQFVASLQAELRAIACRVQMPEWMLTADASNANLASTLVAEAPSTKAFEAVQGVFKRRFAERKACPGRSLIWRQIDYAVRCGILPRQVYQFVGVQCEPPSLVVRNRLAEAQTDDIYLKAGVKSVPTIRLQQGLDGPQEDRGFASHPPPAAPAAGPPADPSAQPAVADPGGQRARESGTYNEDDHPRDDHGRWGSGSSGAAAGTPAAAAKDQPGPAPDADKLLAQFERSGKKVELQGLLGTEYGSGVPGLLKEMFKGAKVQPTVQDLADLAGATKDAKWVRARVDKDPYGRPCIKIKWDHDSFQTPCMRELRTDAQGKPYVYNDLIKLDANKKGGGLGTKVFGLGVQTARRLGINTIKCYAARHDASGRSAYDGYKVWPGFGYNEPFAVTDAYAPEVVAAARAAFPGVQDVLGLYAKPGGPAWWAEHGTGLTKMEFDTRNGSTSMKTFSAKLDRRQPKTAAAPQP